MHGVYDSKSDKYYLVMVPLGEEEFNIGAGVLSDSKMARA